MLPPVVVICGAWNDAIDGNVGAGTEPPAEGALVAPGILGNLVDKIFLTFNKPAIITVPAAIAPNGGGYVANALFAPAYVSIPACATANALPAAVFSPTKLATAPIPSEIILNLSASVSSTNCFSASLLFLRYSCCLSYSAIIPGVPMVFSALV